MKLKLKTESVRLLSDDVLATAVGGESLFCSICDCGYSVTTGSVWCPTERPCETDGCSSGAFTTSCTE